MHTVKMKATDPATGMRAMGHAIDPGDHLVLIQGEDHRFISEVCVAQPNDSAVTLAISKDAKKRMPVGWAILDARNRIIAWAWIEDTEHLAYGDFIRLCIHEGHDELS
jgi:hypothetical protein